MNPDSGQGQNTSFGPGQGALNSGGDGIDWQSVIRGSSDAGTSLWYVARTATRTAESIAMRNGTTPERIRELNPGVLWPVDVGTSVRVSG